MLTHEQDGAFHWTSMHSPVQLHLPGVGELGALAVARAVEADLEASEQALSRFRPAAELVRLNACQGSWVQVSPRLYTALSAALQAFRRTGGFFDPRVLESLERYGYAGAPHGGGPLPAGFGPWLERRPRARQVCALAALDLGGIGKGLAVRWGARIAAHVAWNFLLNAGGDLIAAGPGPEGRGWQVGVEDPLQQGDLVAALQLPEGGAVCTSSIATHRWQSGGAWVHHLIDPRSGRPGGEGLLAVTVVGRDPAWTEVWSKALFLQGRRDIARNCGRRAVLWISVDGTIAMSDAMRGYVFWRRRG